MKNLIAGAVFSLAFAAQAQDLPKTALSIVGGIGITTQYKVLEEPFWSKKIAEASKGTVTATIKPWNEMSLKGPEVFRLLQRGAFDGVTGFLGHMAGDIPINEGIDLPGLSPTYDIFKQVSERFRPALEAEYEKLGMKVLGVWSYQAQVLFCQGELKGLSDLKGKKVRTSGAAQAEFLAYFGGSGLPIAFGEVQEAMNKGVIDCAITGTLSGYKAKWTDGAKSVYPLPITWGSLAFAMNLKKWNSLDPRVQAFLAREIKSLESDIWEQNRREHQVGIACSTSGPCPEGPPAGLKLGVVPAGDEQLRGAALKSAVLPAWAKRCGPACVASWNSSIGKMLGYQAQ